MEQYVVAIVGVVFTFVSTVIGAWFTFRRGAHDDMAKFRDDLLQMNKSLREEITELRTRVYQLEESLDCKTREIDRLELTIARINLYLLKEHGIDLEKIFGELLNASS